MAPELRSEPSYGAHMRAQVGDRITLKGTHVGAPNRSGVIIELRHPDGSPPYVVRWLDDGHEGLVFPGPDAHIDHPAITHGHPTPPEALRP
jgi:hypothetical protein